MPCIELSYTLEAGNKVLHPTRAGLRPRLSAAPETQYNEHDPLSNEKRMLAQWFRERFAAGGQPLQRSR